jgi:hypothetical protein
MDEARLYGREVTSDVPSTYATDLRTPHAYHRDTHNPSVIDSIGRLLFAAVVRLVVRCQSNSLGVGSRQPRLEQFGVTLGSDLLTMRDAAEAISVRLLEDLDTDVDVLALELVDDLEARRAEVEELLDYLRTSGHDLDELIAMAEFGDKQAADEELLRLASLMDPVRRAKEMGLSQIPDEFSREAQEAVRQYRARIAELERTRPPEMKVARLDEVRAGEDELRTGGDVAVVLSGYYEADVVLTTLERYAGEAVSAYDQHIE